MGRTNNSTRNYATMQRRLLPHAQAYSRSAAKVIAVKHNNSKDWRGNEELVSLLGATHMVGLLYVAREGGGTWCEARVNTSDS
jgi:hypothetical protein